MAVYINKYSAWHCCWKLPLLLLLWFVYEVFLMPTSAQAFFKWLHLPLTGRQLGVIHHTTGWWVWPWIYLLCVTCRGENGTNGCQLTVFSLDVAFARHFLSICPPPCSSPTGVLVILATPVKILYKMVGNSARYTPNSWLIDRLWIAIELWQISYKHLFSFSSYNTSSK